MATTLKPIFFKAQQTSGYLTELEDNIKKSLKADADLLLNYPTIYVHIWRTRNNLLNGTWSIYIGETNNIISRTKEHWAAAKIPEISRKSGNWQHQMLEAVDDEGNPSFPVVYFFGHSLFHKSLALDIENKLIDFCMAMETAHIYNGRGNPQNFYSGYDNFDTIFSMIWRVLRNDNSELFLTEASIKKSAIYKASPNHKLTEDQKAAKQLIIDRTVDSIVNRKNNQLIFVEGEAGTGKTVLASSTFYGIIDNEILKDLNLSCYMLMNHEEQRNVYKSMARKLGYTEDIVKVPTSFIKEHSILDDLSNTYIPTDTVDIVFIDEAHLLWNQTNQAFDSKFKEPQLDEIMKRARVTVIMFDENQILHKGQISTGDYIDKKILLAKSQGPNPSAGESNYIRLVNQLRMNCSIETMKWVDDLSKKLELNDLVLNSKYKDSKNYEIRVFDTPAELHNAIKLRASRDETQLSRVIATYDWKYILNTNAPSSQKYWQLDIDGWTLPWNEQRYRIDLKHKLKNRQKLRYAALNWAEKDYSIDEAGSTFTIQGFDLAYSGVILGPSIRYDRKTNMIEFDESLRAWNNMTGNRTLQDGSILNVTNTISKHELRVLMTRGTKGLYIYACDANLRKALRKAIKTL
ncbi:hypothetical protein ADM98_05490 [Exiguobacterium sp. BMC-KP]|uniref:DNA/RNA helicase domain-containing protein n=1 Tax=Exiguobacterium sp. BMC-KP TaxID=1684312 RepID=UPI0006AA1E93|nr:DNA/RNA helicase domain-containing protein [Exiguobacterium sp. BMC-KP]KOP30895.1 hypothetical protein ADM98_05490 [Exiguobacterium sp. BMC-KP]